LQKFDLTQDFLQCIFLATVVLTALQYVVAVLVALKPDGML